MNFNAAPAILFSWLIPLVFIFSSCTQEQTGTYDAKWVVKTHPEKVKLLFDSLNLDYPGLEQVKESVEANNLIKACGQLCGYYQNIPRENWRISYTKTREKWFRPVSSGNLLTPEMVMADSVINQGKSGKLKRRENGSIDWEDRGPADDKEWAWFVNRFYFLRPLLDAYSNNPEDEYAAYFDAIIRDWIEQNPVPSEKTGNATWRVLEVGLRMVQSWPYLFYNFQNSEKFEVGTRILFLSSIVDHASYLQKFHWFHHNHSVMEMNGLAYVALLWPELKPAESWYAHAKNQMLDDLTFLAYPDGAEIELSSTYHRVALVNFEEFYHISKLAGKDVGEEFATALENMWNYLAYTTRPSGTGLLNNDSDLDDNRKLLGNAAHAYDRSDWEYIISNGKNGEKPEQAPVYFDWAGQLISRNNWTDTAHWAYFDVGCWGWSHQHEDMLHISIQAFGKDILVDGGRYWYKNPYDVMSQEGRSPTFWRGYFLHSASHNTVLIDGNGQKPPGDRVKLDKPLPDSFSKITSDYVFAKGVHKDGYWNLEGKAEHTRSMVYLKDKYWLVIDEIDTDKPRKVETLWHFHPSFEVGVEQNTVFTKEENEGNLGIVPSQGTGWEVEIVKGQEEPAIQGWYSERYNSKEASPTAIYTQNLSESSAFGWLLLPTYETKNLPTLDLKKTGRANFEAIISFGNGNLEKWMINTEIGEVSSE